MAQAVSQAPRGLAAPPSSQPRGPGTYGAKEVPGWVLPRSTLDREQCPLSPTVGFCLAPEPSSTLRSEWYWLRWVANRSTQRQCLPDGEMAPAGPGDSAFGSHHYCSVTSGLRADPLLRLCTLQLAGTQRARMPKPSQTGEIQGPGLASRLCGVGQDSSPL